VPGRPEPAEVTHDREDGGGTDVTDPDDAGERRAVRLQRLVEARLDGGDAAVAPAPVIEQLLGHLPPLDLHQCGRTSAGPDGRP
jgi:hypothetical protein